MKQKGFSKIIVIIVIVLMAGLWVYFFLMQNLTVEEQMATDEQRNAIQKTKEIPSITDVGASKPPRIVKRLCSNRGEQEFVTEDGQQHTFFESAGSVQRCNAGDIWAATEDGRKVNDAARFYFDVNGVLLDICQPLFWRSGCERFKDISCEEKNYCIE